jgi:hypothetical protein
MKHRLGVPRLRTPARAACAGLAALLGAAASSQAAAVHERLALDARAGRPLVAHVFVALCDNRNQGIVPVPARLGNGQAAHENLYWGARFGVRTYWRGRKPWRAVATPAPSQPGVLERAAFLAEEDGTRVFVVADAWDGARIRETVGAFLEAAAGRARETVRVGGESLEVGGASHVVVFVGHNGLMDFPAPVLEAGRAEPARAAMVLACASRPYFFDLLKRAGAHPLLLTTGLMAPEAYSLEASLRAWFATRDEGRVRLAAAEAYDRYQHCGRRAALRLFAAAD